MWNDLTMSERADVIKMAVKAGLRDMKSIRDFYDDSLKYAEGGLKNIVEHNGMVYNVTPSALQSNNLTVELPEVKVSGKRKNKGYKSAFNPNGAVEFAGTIMNSPLQLGDYAFNRFIDASKGEHGKTDYRYTPVQTTAQRVGETLSPTRWIGTVKSGFKESPWSENNPGLTGDPYLDTMIDIGVGGLGIKGGKYIKNLRQNIELTNKINKEKPIIEAFRKGLKEADDYKNSEGYKELIQKAREESKQLGFGDFSDELFINAGKKEYPLLKIEPRNKGAVAGYKYSANRISIDPSQLNKYERDVIPYHESLHYKRIGYPEPNTPKYKAWAKGVDDNLPKTVRSKLWNDFYNSDEYYMFKEHNNAETYLDHKINNALRESADPYLKIKGELQANGLEAGKAIGIKPFTKYPGIKDATEAYIKAKNYNPILLGLKTKTPQDFKNIWDILTGNYIPSAIPLTIGGVTLSNKKAEGGTIHIDPSKRGTFTAAATKHGMGVQEFASKVLANKDDYSPAMVKKANFARNFGGHKHSLGGYLFI